jgi:hypothetical protein
LAVAIKQQEINGEQVIFLGPGALVASKSEPGTWYSVDGGYCSCSGFQYRGRCRHVAVAALAVELDRMASVPVPAPVRPKVSVKALLTIPE